MAQGRVVFDDAPEALTEHVTRDLYGLEAGEVMDKTQEPISASGAEVRPAAALA
jgi:phosphonate transport system ATP-binding protein